MTSIKESLEKIKPFYHLLLIIVISGIFFTLGRISALKTVNEPIKIEYEASTQMGSVINSGVATATVKVVQNPVSINQTGEVIGSKSGKKYYFPWCGTVKRILPQNQVHFASIEEARAAGFNPGGNCKGLK